MCMAQTHTQYPSQHKAYTDTCPHNPKLQTLNWFLTHSYWGPFLCKFPSSSASLDIVIHCSSNTSHRINFKEAEDTLILLNTNDDTAQQRGLSHGRLGHTRPVPSRHEVIRLSTCTWDAWPWKDRETPFYPIPLATKRKDNNLTTR